MIHLFRSMFTQDELEPLKIKMMSDSRMKPELDTRYYFNSMGFYQSEGDQFKDKLETALISVIDQPIKWSNSFYRIYQNGSYLGIHTDRRGLDVTVSLCVSKESKDPWPLYVSNKEYHGAWDDSIDMVPYKQDYQLVNLEPGDAGVVFGTKFPHWREPLDCLETEKNLYVFYHWSFAT